MGTWLLGQQVLRVGITDILSIVNIGMDITDIGINITDIAMGIADIVNSADIADRMLRALRWKQVDVYKVLWGCPVTGAGACIVVLLRVLYTYNLLLSRLPSCFIAAAVYRVSVEFLFKSSRNFKRGKVGVNN